MARFLRGPCERVTYTTKRCPLACVRAVSRRRRRYSVGIRYVQEQIEREVIDGINKHPPRPLTHTTPPSLPLPPSVPLLSISAVAHLHSALIDSASAHPPQPLARTEEEQGGGKRPLHAARHFSDALPTAASNEILF